MLKPSAQKVQDALNALGFQDFTVLELPASTRSAAEAAQAVGCQVGQIAKADADFVRQQTGFTIGGVPPVGHSQPLDTFIDADLLAYDHLWAAAGTPHAVFQLTPDDLVRITGGQVEEFKQI